MTMCRFMLLAARPHMCTAICTEYSTVCPPGDGGDRRSQRNHGKTVVLRLRALRRPSGRWTPHPARGSRASGAGDRLGVVGQHAQLRLSWQIASTDRQSRPLSGYHIVKTSR